MTNKIISFFESREIEFKIILEPLDKELAAKGFSTCYLEYEDLKIKCLTGLNDLQKIEDVQQEEIQKGETFALQGKIIYENNIHEHGKKYYVLKIDDDTPFILRIEKKDEENVRLFELLCFQLRQNFEYEFKTKPLQVHLDVSNETLTDRGQIAYLDFEGIKIKGRMTVTDLKKIGLILKNGYLAKKKDMKINTKITVTKSGDNLIFLEMKKPLSFKKFKFILDKNTESEKLIKQLLKHIDRFKN